MFYSANTEEKSVIRISLLPQACLFMVHNGTCINIKAIISFMNMDNSLCNKGITNQYNATINEIMMSFYIDQRSLFIHKSHISLKFDAKYTRPWILITNSYLNKCVKVHVSMISGL
jgi:hypothetical protein